ncbi:unnamed protein product [Rotaria sp. Silwood1]|nr:unnamed protein product [Rotaria sp. Silwood1]
MPYRRITSIDVASIPQPGYNLAESIHFSPDDNILTYIRSPCPPLIRKLYAYDLRKDKEFVFTEMENNDEAIEDNLSQEQFQRERQHQLIPYISRYQWAKDKTQSIMLIPMGSDLYVYNKKQFHLLVNGSHQAPILDPKLSPDGKLVAYVQDCELYCISTASSMPLAVPRQLTFDARNYPNKTNGLAEFIAQEEMDRNDGFWWSDDSRFIAFTQVDESNVPVFRISHSGSSDPDHVEEHRYPFAGKANVQVTVGIIDVTIENNQQQPIIHWVDLSALLDI